eukprot:gene16914-20099_t
MNELHQRQLQAADAAAAALLAEVEAEAHVKQNHRSRKGKAKAINEVLTERAVATEGAEVGEESLEERATCEGMEAAAAPRAEWNVGAGNAARSKQEKERERKARQKDRKAAATTRALEEVLEEVERQGTGSGGLEALTQAMKEAERFTRDNPDLLQLMGRARATAKAASLEHLEEDMTRMAMANRFLSGHGGGGAQPPCGV